MSYKHILTDRHIPTFHSNRTIAKITNSKRDCFGIIVGIIWLANRLDLYCVRSDYRYDSWLDYGKTKDRVDYVLCDKQILKPVYAVELDDYTHN